jgi:hypothetical protein
MDLITLNKTPYGVHLQENNGIDPGTPNVCLFLQYLCNKISFVFVSLSFPCVSPSFYSISFLNFPIAEVYCLFGRDIL